MNGKTLSPKAVAMALVVLMVGGFALADTLQFGSVHASTNISGIISESIKFATKEITLNVFCYWN